MPSENPLLARRHLRRRLLDLSYRAFLQCVLYLLSAEGCGVVRPAGRQLLKGRNRAGGWDAEAEGTVGPLGPVRCIVQAKQYDTLPVHQRAVDELRGSCLRAGAHRAVLMTLSTFSTVARAAADADTRLAPIRLIDGDEFLDLLIRRGVGVWRKAGERWEVNDAYFNFLEERFGTVGTPVAKVRGKQKGVVGAPAVTITLTFSTKAKGLFKPERL